MGLLELIEQRSFLGEEFLTWLLWKSSTEPEGLGLPDGSAVELRFESPLVLKAPYGDAEEVSLRGEGPALSPEAAVALAQGKKLSRAKLALVIEQSEWRFTVRADTLDVTGLRIPLRTSAAEAVWIEQRLEMLRRFFEVFEALFDLFLAARLSPRKWPGETKAIRAWIASRVVQTIHEPELIHEVEFRE